MFNFSRALRRAYPILVAAVLLSSAAAIAQESESAPPERVVVVDINSAPVEAIRGVVLDDGLAERIVQNRPYANKRQLVSRNLVTVEQYDEIKDRIIARRGTPEPEQ